MPYTLPARVFHSVSASMYVESLIVQSLTLSSQNLEGYWDIRMLICCYRSKVQELSLDHRSSTFVLVHCGLDIMHLAFILSPLLLPE